MPIGYTEAYAKRLDEASALTVVEAREGELVRPGIVFVAPRGPSSHVQPGHDAARFASAWTSARSTSTHRPSVDVLFQSAAEVYGDRVLALS